MKRLLVAFALFLVLAGCGKQRWIIEGVAASVGPDRNRREFAAEVLELAADRPGDYPTIFYGHDYSQVIGRLVKARYLNGMLLVEIEISQDRPDLWKLIKAGYLSGISIAGVVLEAEPTFFEEWEVEGTLIKRMLVVEVSVVAIPAHSGARILQWREE